MYKWQEQTSWFGEEQIICIRGMNKLHGLVRNKSYALKCPRSVALLYTFQKTRYDNLW